MRYLSFSLKLILLALVAIMVIPACKDDEPEPDTATIHGTISLDHSELWSTWKDSGVVELTIFPEFTLNPPAGWGDIPVDGLYPGFPGGRFPIGAPSNASDPFIINVVPGQTEYHYELKVKPGIYSALAVGFRHNLITDPAKKSATLGVAWGHSTELSHGLLIKLDAGGGQFITIIDDPAPIGFNLEKGDKLEVNFKADLGFVQVWPFR